MKDIKVLVGCPVSNHKSYCFEQYADAVKNLSYKNYDILLVDNSKTEHYFNFIKGKMNAVRGKYFEGAKERIVYSRNILRQKVLDEDYDYFLSLEQDVIPPVDVIERLLKHKKKIISGVYFVSFEEHLAPVLYKRVKGDEVRYLTFEEVKDDELIEVDACGLGCILIHKDVLKKVKFRYDKTKEPFDDIWFCIDAAKNGFKLYCDTSVKCMHMIGGRWGWNDIKK
ncbi:MAG: hypothetical protein AB1571_04180, partial [Nanoarchaeota archaeon]